MKQIKNILFLILPIIFLMSACSSNENKNSKNILEGKTEAYFLDDSSVVSSVEINNGTYIIKYEYYANNKFVLRYKITNNLDISTHYNDNGEIIKKDEAKEYIKRVHKKIEGLGEEIKRGF